MMLSSEGSVPGDDDGSDEVVRWEFMIPGGRRSVSELGESPSLLSIVEAVKRKRQPRSQRRDP
jgi:hypothetical protein